MYTIDEKHGRWWHPTFIYANTEKEVNEKKKELEKYNPDTEFRIRPLWYHKA